MAIGRFKEIISVDEQGYSPPLDIEELQALIEKTGTREDLLEPGSYTISGHTVSVDNQKAVVYMSPDKRRDATGFSFNSENNQVIGNDFPLMVFEEEDNGLISRIIIAFVNSITPDGRLLVNFFS